MDELLATAINAHGGLDRWQKVRSARFAASITGAVWHLKSVPDVLADIEMTVSTDTERVETTFRGQDRRSVFEPGRVVVERTDGTVLLARDDPEASFAGQQADTPWDDVHVAYFSGEALWTYLNVPFLYAEDDFRCTEIAPIQVDGETWRRLEVIFPDRVRSHTRRQVSCFGPDGLLRRHDYTVDILQGTPGLNYASQYQDVEGIVVPTRRRIYGYTGDYELVPEPLLVAVDLSELSFD